MKKICLGCFLFAVFFNTSCKKETVSPGGSQSGTGSSSGTFTNIYGTMISEQRLTYYPTIPYVDTAYSAIAWFFNAPQHNWIFGPVNTTTPVGSVYLDSIKLQLYNSLPGIIFYIDSTYQLKLKSNNSWQVTGAGYIPSISFNFTGSWPSYTGYALLPDTIHKTQDNVIILTNIVGADSISININDNTNISGHSYTSGKVALGTSVSITLPASKVGLLSNTANGSLTVSLFKFAPVQPVGGKNFVFVKDVEFKRTVEIDNF